MMLKINLANFSDEEISDLLHELSKEMSLRIKTRIQAGKFPVLDEEERNFVYEGRPIEAIKAYRTRTGVGLRESKCVVDEFRDYMRQNTD